MTIPELAAKAAEMWVVRGDISIPDCAALIAGSRAEARPFVLCFGDGIPDRGNSRESLLARLEEMARGI